MPKLERQVGTTSLIIEVNVLDTAVGNGAGKTGLTNGSAGLTCYYKRNTGTASVSCTINTITTFGTYNGSSTAAAFKEVDPTNMTGTYELHVPNNCLASGADSVVLVLQGAAGMAPVRVEIELTATNNQDATRGGMTALPNANAATAGGLLTSGTGANQITTSSGQVTVGTNNDKTGYSLTQAFPSNFASMLITAGGQLTVGTNNDKTGYSLTQAFPANFAAMLISVGGAVTVGTNNDKTGYALTQLFPTNFAIQAIDGSGRVTYAPGEMAVKKNTALNNFEFVLVSSADHVTPLGAAPGALAGQRSINGAGFAATANAPAFLANGVCTINLANTDLNGDVITFLFTATGADPRLITVVTQA